MIALFAVEVQRALRRMVVQGLMLIAVIGIVAAAVIVHFTASEFKLVDVWRVGEDGVLGGTSFLLFMGALAGAASVVGAEWRYGTMATLLTWETRRVRVLLVKLSAVAVLAFVIAVVLQTLLVAALAVVASVNGATAGADWTWFRGVVSAELRIGAMAALGAVLAGSISMIGRSTAPGVVVVAGYMFVVEPLLRVWKPRWASWFLIENLVVLASGGNARDVVDRSVLVAAATLCFYAIVIAGAALIVFRRRDVASA